MTAPHTVTVLTTDHGPVTTPEPDWCTGNHTDSGPRCEIYHQGPGIDITVGTESGPRRLLALALWQDAFPEPTWPHGAAVYVVAHLLDGEDLGYDVAGLERLATDVLEAARRVRLVAARLASETRR